MFNCLRAFWICFYNKSCGSVHIYIVTLLYCNTRVFWMNIYFLFRNFYIQIYINLFAVAIYISTIRFCWCDFICMKGVAKRMNLEILVNFIMNCLCLREFLFKWGLLVIFSLFCLWWWWWGFILFLYYFVKHIILNRNFFADLWKRFLWFQKGIGSFGLWIWTEVSYYWIEMTFGARLQFCY